jgi:Secretion system C-terminal sorting domain
MEKYLFFLLFTSFLIKTNAQTDTLEIGKKTFAISSNNYGPFRSIQTPNLWSRFVYIYPESLLEKMPIGTKIKSLSFYKDAYRNNPLTRRPGKPQGNALAKIWIANTEIEGWQNYSNWDTIMKVVKPVMVFDTNLTKIIIDTLVGWKEMKFLSNFTYTGRNIALMFQYEQDLGTDGDVYWAYDDSTVVKEYSKYQMKYNTNVKSIMPLSSDLGTVPPQIQDNHPTTRFNFIKLNSKVTEVESLKELILSPNPAKENMTLHFSASENITVEVEIIDILGRILLREKAEILRGINSYTLKINTLDSGNYFVILKKNEQQTVRQFIKQ